MLPSFVQRWRSPSVCPTPVRRRQSSAVTSSVVHFRRRRTRRKAASLGRRTHCGTQRRSSGVVSDDRCSLMAAAWTYARLDRKWKLTGSIGQNGRPSPTSRSAASARPQTRRCRWTRPGRRRASFGRGSRWWPAAGRRTRYQTTTTWWLEGGSKVSRSPGRSQRTVAGRLLHWRRANCACRRGWWWSRARRRRSAWHQAVASSRWTRSPSSAWRARTAAERIRQTCTVTAQFGSERPIHTDELNRTELGLKVFENANCLLVRFSSVIAMWAVVIVYTCSDLRTAASGATKGRRGTVAQALQEMGAKQPHQRKSYHCSVGAALHNHGGILPYFTANCTVGIRPTWQLSGGGLGTSLLLPRASITLVTPLTDAAKNWTELNCIKYI